MINKKINFQKIQKYLNIKKLSINSQKKTIKYLQENNILVISRTLLSCVIIILTFFMTPIIINFTEDRTLLSKEFENNKNIEMVWRIIKYYLLQKGFRDRYSNIDNINIQFDEVPLLNSIN